MQMAKVTLNDIEYDSEDFNETQIALLAEIQYSATMKRQLEFQLASVSNMGVLLVDKLKQALEDETIPEEDA
jgi:ABC-type polysaccharide/polyol phosphate transport system ATPase subunit|tara:strand:+ start:344 stop:559 length:216 start_codon:yes stop_codon:yes gene_type:complete